MFSKPTTRPGDGPEHPTRKPGVASLVAEGVLIRGDLATGGDLHLDGALEGDVRVGRLTLGETGAVTGSITADAVEIHGRVTGAIIAGQVRLCASARVEGDISHAELAIEAGAHFAGRSIVLAPAVASEPLSVAAE
jgi:cytoskeletal protein CcmA (bactofilin family)